ncbi:MAG: hypothetical protein ACXWKO_12405, partial [Phenylobacterium sp.]
MARQSDCTLTRTEAFSLRAVQLSDIGRALLELAMELSGDEVGLKCAELGGDCVELAATMLQQSVQSVHAKIAFDLH